MGFDPSFKHPTCLATLKSCDTTKQSVFGWLYIYIYIYINVRQWSGELGSIPGRVIPKTLKMVLDTSLLNTRQYMVRIEGKVEQSRKGVAPFPTPWCSCYRKGTLLVAPDSGRQLYLYIYIYIYIIITSRRQHGYPWPSLATSPYHSSPPAGLQRYILCPHIVAVCRFVLVVLLLHTHMWGSTGVHRLWARPCFSSSVPQKIR